LSSLSEMMEPLS